MFSSFLKKIQDYNFVGEEEAAINKAITKAGGPPLRDPVSVLNALARLEMTLPYGLDSLPILATVAGLHWKRSLFPMSGGDFRKIVAAVTICPVETSELEPELLRKAEVASAKFPVTVGESPALGFLKNQLSGNLPHGANGDYSLVSNSASKKGSTTNNKKRKSPGEDGEDEETEENNGKKNSDEKAKKEAGDADKSNNNSKDALNTTASRKLQLDSSLNNTTLSRNRSVRFLGNETTATSGAGFGANRSATSLLLSSLQDDEEEEEESDDDYDPNFDENNRSAVLSPSENKAYIQDELYHRGHSEKEETEEILKELFSVPRPSSSKKIKSTTLVNPLLGANKDNNNTNKDGGDGKLQRKDSNVTDNNTKNDEPPSTTTNDTSSSSHASENVCFSAEKIGTYFEAFGLHPRAMLKYFQNTEDLENMVKHATFTSMQRKRKSFTGLPAKHMSPSFQERYDSVMQQDHHHTTANTNNTSTQNSNNNTNSNQHYGDAAFSFTPARVSSSATTTINNNDQNSQQNNNTTTNVITNQNDEALSPIVTLVSHNDDNNNDSKKEKDDHYNDNYNNTNQGAFGQLMGSTSDTFADDNNFGYSTSTIMFSPLSPGSVGASGTIGAGGGGRRKSMSSKQPEVPQVFEVELDDFSWWLNQKSSGANGYNTPRTASRARHRWRVAIFAVLQTVRASLRGLEKGASSMDLLGGGKQGGFVGFAQALFNFTRENRLESTALKDKIKETVTKLDSSHEAKFRQVKIDTTKQLGNADGVLQTMPQDRRDVEMMLRRMTVPVYGDSGTSILARKILESRVHRKATESVILTDENAVLQISRMSADEKKEYDALHPVRGCGSNAAGNRALQKMEMSAKTDVVERLLRRGPKGQARSSSSYASRPSSANNNTSNNQDDDNDNSTNRQPLNKDGRRSTLVYEGSDRPHDDSSDLPIMASSASKNNRRQLPPLPQQSASTPNPSSKYQQERRQKSSQRQNYQRTANGASTPQPGNKSTKQQQRPGSSSSSNIIRNASSLSSSSSQLFIDHKRPNSAAIKARSLVAKMIGTAPTSPFSKKNNNNKNEKTTNAADSNTQSKSSITQQDENFSERHHHAAAASSSSYTVSSWSETPRSSSLSLSSSRSSSSSSSSSLSSSSRSIKSPSKKEETGDMNDKNDNKITSGSHHHHHHHHHRRPPKVPSASSKRGHDLDHSAADRSDLYYSGTLTDTTSSDDDDEYLTEEEKKQKQEAKIRKQKQEEETKMLNKWIASDDQFISRSKKSNSRPATANNMTSPINNASNNNNRHHHQQRNNNNATKNTTSHHLLLPILACDQTDNNFDRFDDDEDNIEGEEMRNNQTINVICDDDGLDDDETNRHENNINNNRTLNGTSPPPQLNSFTKRPGTAASRTNNNINNNNQAATKRIDIAGYQKRRNSPSVGSSSAGVGYYSSPVSPMSRTIQSIPDDSLLLLGSNNNKSSASAAKPPRRRTSPVPQLSPRDDGNKPCRTRRKLDEALELQRVSKQKQTHEMNLEKRTLHMEASMQQSSVLNKIGKAKLKDSTDLYGQHVVRRKL